MTINSDLLESAKKSLKDCRSKAAVARLEDLLFYKDFKDRPVYRVTDENGKEIKSVDDLIALLTEGQVEFRYPDVTDYFRFHHDFTKEFVIFKNLTLKVTPRTDENSSILDSPGKGLFRIALVMGYLADNDKEIPMKFLYPATFAINGVVE